MSKDPAFLFYPKDFTSDTQFMTDQEIGIYMRIVCAMHYHGRLSKAQMDGLYRGITTELLQSKFEKDNTGKFYCVWLEEQIEKRRQYSEKQSNRIKKRWNKDTNHGNTVVLPKIVNANVNAIVNENILEGGVGGDFNWESVKGYFLNADEWMFKFCSSKSVSRDSLVPIMTEFLNEMELRNEYKDLKELQRHFTNWFNIKNKKNANYFDKFSKATRGAHELLEELRAESQANFRSHEPNPTQGDDTYPALQ